jgi:hypothetical protein
MLTCESPQPTTISGNIS